MKTEIIKKNISKAARLIKSGKITAVPTETVYGLACSAMDAGAVARVYALKGRPPEKPLSLLVPGPEALEKYCMDIPKAAYTLAEKFWPGPLTIVLKSSGVVPDVVTAGGDTVGLRCPKHDLTLKLLAEISLPLAAPSANLSGQKPPATAGEVLEYFGGKIDGVIDGGRCEAGAESTIIDLSRSPYRILREGALSSDEIIRAVTGAMNIIGLTGGSGTGKTTALKVSESLGALAIDCDDVYHELLESNQDMVFEISSQFEGVVTDGVLRRKDLGQIVFRGREALERLNSVTHKYIRAEVDKRLSCYAMEGGKTAAVAAIALIESGRAEKCSTVVGITASPEVRLLRITERESLLREYARMRIDAQKTDEFFRENCDFIIENNGSIGEFRDKCGKLFEELMNNG